MGDIPIAAVPLAVGNVGIARDRFLAVMAGELRLGLAGGGFLRVLRRDELAVGAHCRRCLRLLRWGGLQAHLGHSRLCLLRVGLCHLVRGVESGEIGGERLTEREGFGALCQHEGRHRLPDAGMLPVLAPESGRGVPVGLALPIDRDPCCGRRVAVQPDVRPLSVRTAPVRPVPPVHLAGSLRDGAEPVDPDLDG